MPVLKPELEQAILRHVAGLRLCGARMKAVRIAREYRRLRGRYYGRLEAFGLAIYNVEFHGGSKNAGLRA